MTAPRRQSLRYSISSMWAEGGRIHVALTVEVYIKARGWQRQGLPISVPVDPSLMLAEGVADLVLDEQYRQEKQQGRARYLEIMEQHPQLDLPLP